MFIVGKLVWAILQPGNLLLLCLCGGVLLGLASRGRRGRILVALATFGLLVLAVAPVGPALLLPLEQRFSRPATLPAKIDGILILGGAVVPRLSLAYGETVFNSAVTRVLTGTALARRHPEARVALLSGEGELLPVGYSEARATLGFVLDQGIARDRVILEERSRSTHENAVFAKALIRPEPGQVWVLVTSAYHMPRAVASFRAVGWPSIPYPVDFRVDPHTWLRPGFSLLDGLDMATLAGKEWVGLAAYRMFGWTRELFPAPNTAAATRRPD